MRRLLLATIVALSLAISSQAENIPGNNIPDVVYDAMSGQLSVSTDGADLISIVVEGPSALSIDRWVDGTSQDSILGWEQQYFAGFEQWAGIGSAEAGGSVPQGTYQIATYDVNLVATDFGAVEIGTQNFNTLHTDVTVETENPACDFAPFDGVCDVADLDGILYTGIPGNDLSFDINASGTVDLGDRETWLEVAGNLNIGVPYVRGDTDLDGDVDSIDLNNVGINWQSTTATSWGQGDFDGSGTVVVLDLNDVGINWQHGVAAPASVVPEPASCLSAFAAFFVLLIARRRRMSLFKRADRVGL